MKKLTAGCLLLLTMLVFPGITQARDVICEWSTDDCHTTVWDTGTGWVMWVGCVSGGGGIWNGTGEWGGTCPNDP